MMIAPLIEPNRSPTLESTVPSKFLLLRPRIILFLRCEEIIHTTDTMSEKEIIVMERFVNLFTVVLMPSRPNASNLVRSTLGMNCSKSISCPKRKEKRPNPIRIQDANYDPTRNRSQPNKGFEKPLRLATQCTY